MGKPAVICAFLLGPLLLTGNGTAGAVGQAYPLNPPMQSWFPKAPPLPDPQGNVVRVSTVEDLLKAIEGAQPGQTILVADGHYLMPRYVEIHADNVTLRGASGQRERVILDGSRSRHIELLGVRACSGVTIADLTIQNIRANGFKINSQTNVQKLTIYNCIIHNIWQRGVKGVKVPPEDREAIRPKQCRVQYCLFYNDRPKQLSDDPADIAQGNYVAGIDVMYAKDWTISDNVFVGIQGRTYEGRGAIFLWFEAQSCIVERNIIIDCDVGLQLGNPHRADGVQYHCVGLIARNNFITRAPQAGIVTVYTKDCRLLHNTIHDPQNRLSRLIRTVFTNDGLVVANNLLSGPGLRNESDSEIKFTSNPIKDMADAFVDPNRGNLHLKSIAAEAIDKAVTLPEVAEDIDGQRRDAKPDIGADELASAESREIRIADSAELRAAVEHLTPGTTLLLKPGVYQGGLFLRGVAGTADAPVVIQGMEPNAPPVFRGGGQAIHLSDCSHMTLRHLKATGFPGNGINIDDGGSFETPAHHIVLEDVTILETGPKGNHDALKMSGVDHFIIRKCHFEAWGGSGIDMVGCHHGVVEDCTFTGRAGFSQDNAVQLKGGTEDVLVQCCLFRSAGQRSVNVGGSTGLQFFRPKVKDYEAKNITVAGNRFERCMAPVAWVTADGGHVHHNTIILPDRWVLRILQETSDPQFKPSHGGLFEHNLVIYDSRAQFFVNIGPRTAPETFVFRHNAWCDVEGARRPTLPVAEEDGVYFSNTGAQAYKRPR
jgi:hypothetical protein